MYGAVWMALSAPRMSRGVRFGKWERILLDAPMSSECTPVDLFSLAL